MAKEKKTSSRQRSKDWGQSLPKHESFKKEVRAHAINWFKINSDHEYLLHPKMPYCLETQEEWRKNILLKEVSEYIEQKRKEKEEQNRFFPLHKYVHHGLSSQALVFNLIGPMIVRKDYQPLFNVLKKKNIILNQTVNEAEFEYEDSAIFNEKQGQPTSIDVVLMDEKAKPFIFIESKFTEHEFGGCSVFSSGDCNGKNPIGQLSNCYLHHIGRKYWDLMDEFGFSMIIEKEKICPYINYYQFFREVLFSLVKNGVFTLLYDERSPVFNYNGKGLMPFLMEFVPEEHKKMITMISIQELVSEIEKSSNHIDWIGKFKLKYGIN
jgi:hypothetical protein